MTCRKRLPATTWTPYSNMSTVLHALNYRWELIHSRQRRMSEVKDHWQSWPQQPSPPFEVRAMASYSDDQDSCSFLWSFIVIWLSYSIHMKMPWELISNHSTKALWSSLLWTVHHTLNSVLLLTCRALTALWCGLLGGWGPVRSDSQRLRLPLFSNGHCI